MIKKEEIVLKFFHENDKLCTSAFFDTNESVVNIITCLEKTSKSLQEKLLTYCVDADYVNIEALEIAEKLYKNNTLLKECEHEYLHTNLKYKSLNHMRCIHCGKEINQTMKYNYIIRITGDAKLTYKQLTIIFLGTDTRYDCCAREYESSEQQMWLPADDSYTKTILHDMFRIYKFKISK